MDKIVALKFKTRTEPKYGYPEEVIWDKPVKLIRPEIVGVSKAVSDLNRNEDLGENFKVFYDFKKAVEIKKEYGESSSRVASRFRMRRGSLTNLSQQIKQEYGVELSLLDNGEIIELIKIVIPKDQRGLGLGSKIMGEITAWADQKGKIISLTPSKDFGGSSVSRLVRFYSQFGFKKNKGRNKDFRTRDTMLRYPSEAQGGKVAGLIKPPKRLINDINDFVCHTFITNILYGEDEFREGYTEEELQYFRDNNSFTSKEIKEAQYSGLVLKEIDFPLSSYGLDDTRYKNLKVSVKWADPKGSASAHFHPVTGELSFFWIGQISSNSHGAKHFCNFLKSMVIHEATHAMQYVKHEGGGLPARKKKLPFNVYEYSKSSNYLNNVRYLKNKYGERYGEVFHTLTGVEFYPVLLQQVLSFRFHFQEQNKSHTNSDIRRYLSDSDFFFFLKEEMPKMYLKAVGIFIDEVNKTKEEGLSYKKASRPIRVASLIKKSSF
jgi:GNAT superfamily N-acetyltransferase